MAGVVIPSAWAQAAVDAHLKLGITNVKGRLNQDMFANSKAQSWWGVRTRFQKTYCWIVEKEACNPDDIISIPSKVKQSNGTYSSKMVDKLLTELSQPTMDWNGVGKLVIDKTPDGQKSPNLADAVMIRFCVGQRPMKINEDALRRMGIDVDNLGRQRQYGTYGGWRW